MKTTRIVSILAFVSLFSLAIPTADGLEVSNPNNPHNLSTGATHGRTQATDDTQPGATEICIFCHTPHSASKQGALWNRHDPTEDNNSFPLYSAPLLIKGISAAQYNTTADYPNGATKLCLSCHDGVIGVGTLLDREITMNRTMLEAQDLDNGFNPLIDLSNSHPVSFVFNTEVETALKGKASIPSNPDLRDSQERVQCTTCHNPHDDQQEHVDVPPFWRIVSANPADSYLDLCNKCHEPFGTPASAHHTDAFPK